jgi:molybdate transport system substrate-binding protein
MHNGLRIAKGATEMKGERDDRGGASVEPRGPYPIVVVRDARTAPAVGVTADDAFSNLRFRRRLFVRPVLWLAVVALPASCALADTVTVAVAANFRPAMERLEPMFSSSTVHHVRCVYGSTGGLYAQIANGAPYDLYMAADDEKPAQLVKDGRAIPETRFAYAFGRLSLWSPFAATGAIPRDVLLAGGRIAIAQPTVAPYGRAARATMDKMKVWETVEKDIVYGMDVGQTFQFVSTGAASAGFVALSQVLALPDKDRRWHWIVPESLHPPLRQEAVVLVASASNQAARAFIDFLSGSEVREVIRCLGYGTEESKQSSRSQGP